ncbi:MAG: SURF1 family protein [Gammaproteobacteria bacterium]|nr:SURF1 family protein [Gammaproteobacteria bacterium]
MTLADMRQYIPATAAIVAIAAFSWLGVWQLDRAGEKERRGGTFASRTSDAPILLNERLSATPSEFDPEWWRYRRVEVSGEALGARQYLLDNRTRSGVAGYHVYVPMLVTGLERLVLVNRGWVEIGPSRERRPDVSLTPSELVVSGIVDYPRQPMLLGDDGYAQSSWPKVVQRIDLDKTERDLDRRMLPFVVLMDAELPHGFVREWTPYLGIGPSRHRGYAFQWFSLAAAVAVVWFVVKVRGDRRS